MKVPNVRIPVHCVLEVERQRDAAGYVVEMRIICIDTLGNKSLPSKPIEYSLPDFHRAHEVGQAV
jgi:hypothetical protein